MSLELYVNFEDVVWYNKNKPQLICDIKRKETYAGIFEDSFWLKENKRDRGEKDCPYDVSISFLDMTIYLNIVSNSRAIVRDLGGFLDDIRQATRAYVQDEDGEYSDW